MLLDAAEVVLFRCIDQIKNDNGEVTAIEMSFEAIDDFQDLIEGDSTYGAVKLPCVNPEDETSETQTEAAQFQTEPVPLSKFNNHNHVLQWMVRRIQCA